MIKFLSRDIWSTIKSLSKKSNSTKVAVAYFGTGASKQLTFKRGDTLIVAMHLNNVKAGQVNPYEIEKLYNAGVKIYNLANLHSKIYLFDKKVIIGSPNVSSYSKNTLIETAILTDELGIISQASKFIKEYCIEKVEYDYIELCKKNYKPPKLFGIRKKIPSSNFRGQLSKFWVIDTKLIYFKEEDLKILNKDKKVFEKKISNKQKFEVVDIKYPASTRFINKVKEGDILLEIYTKNSRTFIFQPKRAIGITWNRKKGNAFLRVEERKEPVTKAWFKFKNFLHQNEIKGIKKNSTREIKNENTKKLLLKFFK